MLELHFTPFPVLTTERLVLRQTQQSDVHEVFFLRSDAGVLRYIDRAPCLSLEEAAAFIRRLETMVSDNEGISWAITLKDSDQLIGSIAFWRIEKEQYRAEIGYVLHPDQQGKGIMHEAIGVVLEYGFNTIKLHSVEANTNPENKASQKVLERHNFIREAYFKENYYYAGKFLDSAIYSLVK